MLQAQDPWNETEYLVMWGNFDDGSPVSDAQSSGEYAGKRGDIQPFSDLHRMYPDLRGRRAGLVFFEKLTEPILELAALSDQMANLNFEAKYTGGGPNEIGGWGQTSTGCPTGWNGRFQN